MTKSAVLSNDRYFRYSLSRTWDTSLPEFVVIGLNPSTADENQDDPTIRRCITFAKREKCGSLIMVNLFAFRSTSPEILKGTYKTTEVDRENSKALAAHCLSPKSIVVAAWGNHGTYLNENLRLLKNLSDWSIKVYCFGKTKSGNPKHPLYLPLDCPLEEL